MGPTPYPMEVANEIRGQFKTNADLLDVLYDFWKPKQQKHQQIFFENVNFQLRLRCLRSIYLPNLIIKGWFAWLKRIEVNFDFKLILRVFLEHATLRFSIPIIHSSSKFEKLKSYNLFVAKRKTCLWSKIISMIL